MPQTSLTLGRAKIDRIEFSPLEIEELKGKLMSLTRATVIVRSTKRDEHGKIQYEEVPDSGIQLAATVKALEFAVGKPRQTLDVEDSRGRSPAAQDLRAILGKNPELVTSILGHMQETLRNSQALTVEAVEANPPRVQGESESPSSQR
jgi:hypothetical protein